MLVNRNGLGFLDLSAIDNSALFVYKYIDRYSTYMGARCVGHGGGGARAPRFCEANVKSLILTIGAPPPDLYCARPVLLMCPPGFYSHRAPM